MYGVRLRVQGLGLRFGTPVVFLGSGFRIEVLGFGFQGLGFRVQGSGFRVQGLVYRGQS